MMKHAIPAWSLALALGFILAPTAFAATDPLDLTTVGASGFVGDGFFTLNDPRVPGNYNVDTFVQVDALATEQGYNTTVDGVFDNLPSDATNHAIQVGDVGTVTLNNASNVPTVYREFLLNINQSLTSALLSLDDIQVFLSDKPSQSVTSSTNGVIDLVNNDNSPASLLYRLSTAVPGTASWVKLQDNLATGSADLYFYLPDSLFAGSPTSYVYLYSYFGGQGSPYEANRDPEEWSVRDVTKVNIVPEPATLSLMALGLAGLAAARRRRTA